MNPPRTDARRHHDPEVRGFASDNYAGVHPEVLAALALANGGHQVAYGEDDYTAHLQQIFRSHFGADGRGLPGLQRHRRQRRRAPGGHRPLGRGDLRRDRAHQRRRGRRPRAHGRPQAAHRAHPRRQAHPRADRPAGVRLGRRAPRAAAGRLDHPDHRTGHLLHARGDPGDLRPRPRARHEGAPGRLPHRQRGRLPGRPACGRSPTRSASTSCPSAAPRTALLFGEAVVVLNPDAVQRT